MSLYVRLMCSFFDHRKTAKLKSIIGEAALWIPPRLWAYAAGHQPDGEFSDYTGSVLANLLGYSGDGEAMLQALLEAGFMDRDPVRIHDWAEYNSYHNAYAERARKAANARWQRESSKEKDLKGKEPSIASSMETRGESGITTNARAPKAPRGLQDWQIDKDVSRLKAQIKSEEESTSPNRAILARDRARLRELRTEKARRAESGSAPTQLNSRRGKKNSLRPKGASEGTRFQDLPPSELKNWTDEMRRAVDGP